MLIKRLKIIPFLTLITAVTTAAQTKDVTHYKLEDVPRFEVGAQFSSITVRDPSPISGQSNSESHTEAGIGARFTYNFTGLVAAEAELTFFPHDNDNFNDYTAGRAVQGLFGVKIGKRFERFGLFGKACPGFIRFSRAVSGSRQVTTPTGNIFMVEFNGRSNFAVDLGGVVEFYPSRRIVTRFDIGDTIIRYKDLKFNITPVCPINPALPCINQVP